MRVLLPDSPPPLPLPISCDLISRFCRSRARCATTARSTRGRSGSPATTAPNRSLCPRHCSVIYERTPVKSRTTVNCVRNGSDPTQIYMRIRKRMKKVERYLNLLKGCWKSDYSYSFLTQVNKKKFKINLKVFFEYLQAGVATGVGWGQESGEENERGGGWVREGSGAWEEKWFVGWVCDKVSVAELVRFWPALVFVCRLRVNYY